MVRRIWALFVLLAISRTFGYQPYFEFDRASASSSIGWDCVFWGLSAAWLAAGMMPYCMAMSDSPHITFGQKVGTSLIYFGVPLCGFTIATSLRQERSWFEAGLNVLLAQF